MTRGISQMKFHSLGLRKCPPFRAPVAGHFPVTAVSRLVGAIMTRKNPAMVSKGKWGVGLVWLALLPLTGCGGSDLPPPPRPTMTSQFTPDAPDTFETVLVDPLPVAAARLVPPDGQSIVPLSLDRDRRVYSDDRGSLPNIGVGVSGGSSSRVNTGFGIGFPLFGGGGDTYTISMTTSRLRFRVPDMNGYRGGWQHWVLHLDLDDGANRRSIETLPPAPPLQ
jgi:hypothetical protein